MAIDVNSRVTCRPYVLGSLIDNEMVLMNIEQGEYIGLDPIATDIWQRIKLPVQVSDLVNELGDSYEGEAAVILADVLILLEHLASKGMVEVV